MLGQKKFLFKLLTIKLFFIFPIISFAQILIVSTENNKSEINKIKNIMVKELLIPEEIISVRGDQGCNMTEKDKVDFDIVVCSKKNGELTFPVYKQTILKNSPKISDYYTKDDKEHFNEVKTYLKAMNIPFTINSCSVLL